MEAAQTNKKREQASQKEAAIPPGHAKTPGFTRGSSLAHATHRNRRRKLRFAAPDHWQLTKKVNQKMRRNSCRPTVTGCIVSRINISSSKPPIGPARTK